MNNGQHEDILGPDFIENAVGIKRQLPNGFIAELRDNPAPTRQFIEIVRLRHDILYDLPGVMAVTGAMKSWIDRISALAGSDHITMNRFPA